MREWLSWKESGSRFVCVLMRSQRLGEYNLPDPQCMFGESALPKRSLSIRGSNHSRGSDHADIEFFRSNPRPFFAFAKELFPKSKGFTFVPSR